MFTDDLAMLLSDRGVTSVGELLLLMAKQDRPDILTMLKWGWGSCCANNKTTLPLKAQTTAPQRGGSR